MPYLMVKVSWRLQAPTAMEEDSCQPLGQTSLRGDPGGCSTLSNVGRRYMTLWPMDGSSRKKNM